MRWRDGCRGVWAQRRFLGVGPLGLEVFVTNRQKCLPGPGNLRNRRTMTLLKLVPRQRLSTYDRHGNNLSDHHVWIPVVIIRNVSDHLRHRAGPHGTLQLGF